MSHPELRPLGKADTGSWIAHIPTEPLDRHWALRTLLWGWERAVLGVAWGASRAELKGNRFTVLDNADAAGSRGRAENRVWACRAGLCPRADGKEAEKSSG